jgi:hypothetical protein
LEVDGLLLNVSLNAEPPFLPKKVLNLTASVAVLARSCVTLKLIVRRELSEALKKRT